MKVSYIQTFAMLLFSLITLQSYSQVSDYADAGNGNNRDDILWLTWEDTDLANGIHDNDQATFNMPLGGTLSATFSQVSIAYPVPDTTSDDEDPDGYLPADIKTWCGATLYTAYDLSSSSSEILFSDVSATTGLGNGENGQEIAFKVTYNMTINGYTIPVDFITGDPETTNSDFDETINIQTNANNWQLIENIRGTNYALSGLGTNSVSLTESESGVACSSNVSSGSNSSPVILTKGKAGLDTEIDFEVLFPKGDGHEGVVFGILLPFDQGDAPATYGVASHLQIKNATSGPGLSNDSQLYLGTTKGDSDYHSNNPLFSADADGDNNDDNNDEDGLTNLAFQISENTGATFTIPASDITLNNTTGSIAQLHTWVDFDGNGTFDNDEYTISLIPIGATQPGTDLNFIIPSDAQVGNTIVRFRLTTDNTLTANTPSGPAINGEVEDFKIALYYPEATIDFDGVDDYVDSAPILGALSSATIMGWVKLDSNFNSDGVLFGQDNMFLEVDGTTRLITTTVNGNTEVSADALKLNEWAHVAVYYSSSPIIGKRVRTYINGVETSANSGGGLSGGLDLSLENFTIGKSADSNTLFFKGAIDEVRVFDTVLTESQIQIMMHQEIKQNGVNVQGSIINKNIADFTTGGTILWNNLQAYYSMSDVINSRTSDKSIFNREATLHNITTIQPQTAPIPYQTVLDGAWASESTWLHGDVWDIEDFTNVKNFGIVQINNNISTSNSHSQIGLFIDTDKTLTVSGDNALTNSWYLQLDGTIDLQDDSQLIQTLNSDLVTTIEGKILRRQEGNTNKFWYNYWSSPVGALSATTLTDNNIPATNNINNMPFSADMLKDGNGNLLTFSPNWNNSVAGVTSSYWLFTFQNGLTYNNWVNINETSSIQPGMGYTQKGSGNTGTAQQYIFEGKPNNGTILLAADDVDGDTANESQQDVTLTTTLIGNPYPSALDARKFIADNPTVIQGTIMLWEQWAGSSHYLAEYEGGYGFINAFTTARAYQHADISIASQTQTEGIKRPTFYIPVGQAFFVEVVEDGFIEFNNTQRVFVKESDVLMDQDDPNYADGGSMFFRNSNTSVKTKSQNDTSRENNNTDEFQILRLEFGVSNGASRSFVLGFSEDATDGFDYGLDGGLITDPPADDMGSILNGQQYVIQAFAPITPSKVVDLTLNASGAYTYTLKSTEITAIDPNQDLYLRDNLTGTYYDLRSTQPYNFTSDAGLFNDRFDVVFQTEAEALGVEEFDTDSIQIYVNNLEDKLFVKGLTADAKNLSITNMLGQTIATYNNINKQTLENGISVSNLSSGVYMVTLNTDQKQATSKKVIID